MPMENRPEDREIIHIHLTNQACSQNFKRPYRHSGILSQNLTNLEPFGCPKLFIFIFKELKKRLNIDVENIIKSEQELNKTNSYLDKS